MMFAFSRDFFQPVKGGGTVSKPKKTLADRIKEAEVRMNVLKAKQTYQQAVAAAKKK